MVPPLKENPRPIGPLSISSLPPELLIKIIEQLWEDKVSKLIIEDNATPSDNELRYSYDYPDIFGPLRRVADTWDTAVEHLLAAIAPKVAVVRNTDWIGAIKLLSQVPNSIKLETRTSVTSIQTDVVQSSFPLEIVDAFPNVSEVYVHQRWWRRLRKNWDRDEENRPLTRFSAHGDFHRLIATRDTDALLKGELDQELCDAVCLSNSFAGTSARQEANTTPVTLKFIYVFVADTTMMKDADLYHYSDQHLAFRFAVTLQLNGPSNIVIVEPATITAKFFVPINIEPLWDRQYTKPDNWWDDQDEYQDLLEEQEAADDDREYARLQNRNARARGTTWAEEERLQQSMAAFSIALLLELPDIPGLVSDEEVIREMVTQNDVASRLVYLEDNREWFRVSIV